MRQPSRRQVLKALGVGVASSALPFTLPVRALGQAPQPAAGPAPAASNAAPEVVPSAPSPWSWLAPLAAGDHVANGWHLAQLSAIEDGRAVLELSHAVAGPAQVHVHLREGAARGIAHTPSLDFLLMNGARGATPSDEGLGIAILALASWIERNERAGGVHAEQLAALRSHARRPFQAA